MTDARLAAGECPCLALEATDGTHTEAIVLTMQAPPSRNRVQVIARPDGGGAVAIAIDLPYAGTPHYWQRGLFLVEAPDGHPRVTWRGLIGCCGVGEEGDGRSEECSPEERVRFVDDNADGRADLEVTGSFGRDDGSCGAVQTKVFRRHENGALQKPPWTPQLP